MAYGQTVPSTGGIVCTAGLNWHVVGVVKSQASDPDTVIQPQPPTYSVNNSATAMVRVARESDLSGTSEYDEPSNSIRADAEFAIDAKTDTPDRLDINTVTDPADGETKMAGFQVGDGLLSPASKNKAALTNIEEEFGLTIPRDFVFVYLMAARAGSDVEVDASYQFIATP